MNKNNDNEIICRASELIRASRLTAHVITFGCQQNEADSERIRGMLLELGYTLTHAPETADCIIVNTCAVREHAEAKALSLLGRLKEYGAKREHFCLALVGCAAAETHVVKMIRSNFKYVGFTVEPPMIHRIPELLSRYILLGERGFAIGEDDGRICEGLPQHREGILKSYVSVMYGCNNFCSYCIVPYTRGRERSRESTAVIEECRELVERGAKEITLLGQNVNSYKSDMDFAELITRVAEIPGDFIVRFMTSHPKDVSDGLIDAIAASDGKIAPHFHLPLQSGSDRILAAMNRTYDTERYLSVVDKLRAAVPNISITSDIIVGFPGESDEDFEGTLSIMRRVRFDSVYAFIYSKRRGTPAEKMEGQVPLTIKRARINELLEIQRELAEEKNREELGRLHRVLVEKVEEKRGQRLLSGRTGNNKPVHFVGDESLVGSFVRVKITRTTPHDLYAEII